MRSETKQLLSMVIKHVVPQDAKHRGRHRKEDLNHYLDVIGYVLKTGIQWRFLKEKLHFSTYHKNFVKWSKFRVFEIAHQILIKTMKALQYLPDSHLKNLYIDSSMIKNIKGAKPSVGVNHFDRGRKGNKVTIVVTDTGIPLGMSLDKSNVHDINGVISTLDNIQVKVLGSRLIADKGYISKQLKKTLRQRQIYLVTPWKKNQKRSSLPEIQKRLLAKRNIVENFFSWIQMNRRLRLRYEVKITHYCQFYSLAMIELIHGKIDK